MKKELALIPTEIITNKIYLIRKVKVIFDFDLATLYQVSTKVFNQTIKRNRSRFPSDFMFQLNKKEWGIMNRSQIVTGSQKHRDPRFLPYVFTEHGVAMLASILKSQRAVHVNIAIVRTFIKLRELLSTHKDLIVEIEKIRREQKVQNYKINSVIETINQMLNPPVNENDELIGFRDRKSDKK